MLKAPGESHGSVHVRKEQSQAGFNYLISTDHRELSQLFAFRKPAEVLFRLLATYCVGSKYIEKAGNPARKAGLTPPRLQLERWLWMR